MEVLKTNNVKIYDLSVGKSLPEWLSDRKRRALLKKNVDLRRRIELIQDFDMPAVSDTIRVSPDGQYIMATGVYKPRVKCFDVNNLSLKFERCYDAEAVTFEILSDDYSKIVFLQSDRGVEFHSASGRHFRLRIPKFGRDMKYHYPTCDLFLVGDGSDVYRLNLERGQFMAPYASAASAINRCRINPVHGLLVCGTEEGKVEAWDPRQRNLVGTLDCAFSCIGQNRDVSKVPSISALQFNGDLTLGVGTATGQVLLYDIRSNKPFYVKDHMEGLPIKDVEFHHEQNLVYSMDESLLKIWNQNTGKLYTTIGATAPFNNLCIVPGTGLFFIANEQPKMKTYYVPTMGRAPRWASFLDSLTEELEESKEDTTYDDYKFVTKQELQHLKLDHFIGTDLLKQHLHGYFMDVKLYNKVRSIAQPFEIETVRKKRIGEEVDKARTTSKIQSKTNLPAANKELAMKLMQDQTGASGGNNNNNNNKKKRPVITSNPLEDPRYASVFENSKYEINQNSEEYRLMIPVVSREELAANKKKKKEVDKRLVAQGFEPVDDGREDGKIDDISSDDSEDNSDGGDSTGNDSWSDDDDQGWIDEMKKQHKIIRKERREAELSRLRQPELYELRPGEEFGGVDSLNKKMNKASLGERLQTENTNVKLLGSVGNREMTFSTRKNHNKQHRTMENRKKQHREERKRLVRPMKGIKTKHNPMFSKRRR